MYARQKMPDLTPDMQVRFLTYILETSGYMADASPACMSWEAAQMGAGGHFRQQGAVCHLVCSNF